eukprot:jgi/Botrbrau1/18357/Bobra.0179s0082.1
MDFARLSCQWMALMLVVATMFPTMEGARPLVLSGPGRMLLQEAAAGPSDHHPGQYVAEGSIDIKCTICDTGLRGPQISDRTPPQEAALDVALDPAQGATAVEGK